MEKVKARTLSGFMELLPGPQTQFERGVRQLRWSGLRLKTR